MRTDKLIIAGAVVSAFALGACCAYTHRRVIKALITGEEMPKAPAWHLWVAHEDRRPLTLSHEYVAE